MTIEDKKAMRLNTMGCWWPSRPYSSVERVRQGPNWGRIAEELYGSDDPELQRLCLLAEAEANKTILRIIAKHPA